MVSVSVKYQQLFSVFIISLMMSSLFFPFTWADSEQAVEIEASNVSAIESPQQANEDMTFFAPELEQNTQIEPIIEPQVIAAQPQVIEETEIVDDTAPISPPIIVSVPVKETQTGSGSQDNSVPVPSTQIIEQNNANGDPCSEIDCGKISGTVYMELNGDGIIQNIDYGWPLDAGQEPPQDGWNVYLFDDANSLIGSYLTDTDGKYEFSNLLPGNYFVREEQRTGWIETFPSQNGEYAVSLNSGEIVVKKDFANFEFGVVHSCLFNDLNADGIQDFGTEPGLVGWNVRLKATTPNNDYNQVSVTNQNGCYFFENVPYGNYRLLVEVPQGWTQTMPLNPQLDGAYFVWIWSGRKVYWGTFGETQIIPTISNNSNPLTEEQTTFSNSGTQSVVLPITTVIPPLDHLTWCKSRYNEENPQLETGGCEYKGEIHGSKHHDHNGNGVIDSEDEGLAGWIIYLEKYGSPQVIEAITDAHGNYSFTGLSNGEYNVWEQQKEDWVETFPNQSVYTINITQEEQFYGIDFANAQHGSIHGCKFHDLNQNNEWDENEPSIPNWEINLRNGDNVSRVHTGSDGCYSFTGLMPGTYTIFETQQDGWTQTYPQGHGTHTVEIFSGDNVFHKHFGNHASESIPSKILGCKFNDLNGDGVWNWQDNEPTIAGWTIYLSDGNNVVSTQTMSEGHYGCYEFDNVPAGNYWISEEPRDGWTQTYPIEPNYYSIQVLPGTNNFPYNFGNHFVEEQKSVLRGCKLNDLNNNGEWDEGEPGIADWTIYLCSQEQGLGCPSTQTGQDGCYAFEDVQPGDYYLYEQQRDGWTQTFPEKGGYNLSLQGGEQVDALNFLNHFNERNGSISGCKWNDENANGEWDANESGIPDWTIFLSDVNNVVTTQTNSDGCYAFEDVQPGNYSVYEEQGNGWTQTFPVDPNYYELQVSGGQIFENLNFGNHFIVPATINNLTTQTNSIEPDALLAGSIKGFRIPKKPLISQFEEISFSGKNSKLYCDLAD